MPRCKNGTRKNPKTGICEPHSIVRDPKSKSKSKSKSPPAATRKTKGVSGVAMPKHRIKYIVESQVEFYKHFKRDLTETQISNMKIALENFRYKRSDVTHDFWSDTVITYESARQYAIPASRLF